MVAPGYKSRGGKGSRKAGGGGGGGGSVGDMSMAELKQGIYEKFGVKNDTELLASKNFKMATDGQDLKRKDLQNLETVAQLYRDRVGRIKNDPLNKEGVRGVINGTNIFTENRPWQAFGIDPQASKYQAPAGLKGKERKAAEKEADRQLKADVKNAYRKLSMKYHPDHGGDPDIFGQINKMYRSLSASA